MRAMFREDHEILRAQARRFIADKIDPFHAEWEVAGRVPRSIWTEAGNHGLLCCAIPERYGGGGGDFGHSAVIIEELARSNSSGVGFVLHSDIVAAYIEAFGTEWQKQRWLPQMATGSMIGAIAMTEPGTGSDLKSIKTTAQRRGDDFVISGEKTFISNGTNCQLVIVVARTDADAGARGLSLFCVEEGMPGFRKGKAIDKIGLRAQDTSELFFDEVVVPKAHLLGPENQGFACLMAQLPKERMIIALRAGALLEAMLTATIDYVRHRPAFGQTVFDFQNTKFRLADAKATIFMLRAFLDDCLAKLLTGTLPADVAAMAKLMATEIQSRILDELLQLHGGYGFTRDFGIARAWADARVGRIYGGTSEVMRDIISRNL